MATDSDVKRLTENVSALQKDMAQVGVLVDRLDITIEKLTEVSSTVSQLLAVQGTRLQQQEKTAGHLQELIESRRQEMDNNIKLIYNRIEKVETDIYDEMEDNKDKILSELKELRTEGANQHNEMNIRMSRFEKYVYAALAVGGVLVWFIDKINIPTLFPG